MAINNVLDYVTIATTGNAADFGDLSVARERVCAGKHTTKGMWFGGDTAAKTDVIDTINVASLGNATDFGDLAEAKMSSGCASDGSSRMVVGGGYVGGDPGTLNVLEYINIDSAGNATDFGDMTQAKYHPTGTSNGTRGIMGGGYGSDISHSDVIDYFLISSPANAVDFGDLTDGNWRLGADSGS
jgi:hypothetical protein|tara:strand:- start:250 stop:804 length:555 start_codon:yes stop_codon:yes gene_type:complete